MMNADGFELDAFLEKNSAESHAAFGTQMPLSVADTAPVIAHNVEISGYHLKAFAAFTQLQKGRRKGNEPTIGRRIRGAALFVQPGPTIFLGSIVLSKSSALTNPSRSASSRNVVPFACACLAIFAAFS